MFLNNTEAKLYTFYHKLKIFGNSAMDFYQEFQVQSSFFAGASSSAFFVASSALASGGARALEQRWHTQMKQEDKAQRIAAMYKLNTISCFRVALTNPIPSLPVATTSDLQRNQKQQAFHVAKRATEMITRINDHHNQPLVETVSLVKKATQIPTAISKGTDNNNPTKTYHQSI